MKCSCFSLIVCSFPFIKYRGSTNSPFGTQKERQVSLDLCNVILRLPCKRGLHVRIWREIAIFPAKFRHISFGGKRSARKTGQAARKPFQLVQKGLMSEPAAKIARIMPEVAEKEEMNGSNGVMKNEGPKPETNGVHCLKNGSQNGVAQKEKDVTDGSVLLFKKLSEDAKAPVKGSASAAGRFSLII